MSIRVDPDTGLKVFNTRAAKATDKITGKGYSPIADEALKTLPPVPPGAVFNADEQAKYREFKEARAGAADYMAMEGEFSKYLEDVYSADPIPREALTDECVRSSWWALDLPGSCCGTNLKLPVSPTFVFVRRAVM